MTPTEINRKICELREPLASATILRIDGHAFSKEGNWSAGYGWNSTPELTAFEPIFKWTVSEEANAILLEEMPRAQVSFHPAKFYITGDCGIKTASHWVCLPNFVDDKYTYVSNPDRKTAICLAYISWREGK